MGSSAGHSALMLGEAGIFGLDFVKAGDGCFDFAVERCMLGKEDVERFIEILKSREFQREVAGSTLGIYLQGYTDEIIF